MTSFKNVMERAIRSSYTTKERKYFEEKIATWSLNGWLEDTEVAYLLGILDEVYGKTTTGTQA
jgi:ATP phosphoribosyltransferase